MPQNKIYAFIGTTAAGKTYYSKRLIDKHGFHHIRSTTTRPVRESNPTEYNHLTKEEFEALIEANEILEYTLFNGHYYGKRKSDFDELLKSNHCVLTMTPDRVKQLKAAYPNTVVVCITTEDPLIKNTIKRLSGRGHTKEEILSKLTTIDRDIRDIRSLEKENLIDHTIKTIQGDKQITFAEIDAIIDI